MTDPTDIRDWAKAHGLEVGERGRIPQHVQDAYDAHHPGQADDEEYIGIPGDAPFDPGPPPPTTGLSDGPGETLPAEPKRRWRDRLRVPEAHGRRKSLDRWGDRAWKVAARLMGAPDTCTGRCLEMQAPAAGIILDDILAGTVIDRIAQPLIGVAEKGESAWGLIGPPVLVFCMERQPGLVPYLIDPLKESLKDWVILAGPAIAKAKAREKKALETLAKMKEDGGPSSVDEMVEDIIGPLLEWMRQQQPVPGEVIPEPSAA